MFINVDLPEPELPMTAIISPGATVRSTPRRAYTLFVPIAYTFFTPEMSMTGCVLVMGCSLETARTAWRCSALRLERIAGRCAGRRRRRRRVAGHADDHLRAL